MSLNFKRYFFICKFTRLKILIGDALCSARNGHHDDLSIFFSYYSPLYYFNPRKRHTVYSALLDGRGLRSYRRSWQETTCKTTDIKECISYVASLITISQIL